MQWQLSILRYSRMEIQPQYHLRTPIWTYRSQVSIEHRYMVWRMHIVMPYYMPRVLGSQCEGLIAAQEASAILLHVAAARLIEPLMRRMLHVVQKADDTLPEYQVYIILD